MKQAFYSVVFMAFLAVSAYWYSAASVEADEQLDVPRQSEFDGMYVTVYIEGSQRGTGQILTDAKIVEIAGRKILVGIGAETGHEKNWTQNVRIGIPWDSIKSFYAMTPDQFEDKMKKHVEDKV